MRQNVIAALMNTADGMDWDMVYGTHRDWFNALIDRGLAERKGDMTIVWTVIYAAETAQFDTMKAEDVEFINEFQYEQRRAARYI